MKVTILGSGSPVPVAARIQSGVLIEDGPILVDCGSGVLDKLSRIKPDFTEVKTVFLTHHHLDHTSDLLPLVKARWLSGHNETIIYGPAETENLVKNLLGIHDYLKGMVNIQVTDLQNGDVLETEDLRVECLETRHSVISLAYKFDNKVVISGDTEPFKGMQKFANGCKLLIHECSFPDEMEIGKHSTPTKLGEILGGCNVETVVLTHLYPQMEAREEEMVKLVRKGFKGRIVVARDLMRFEI